MNTTNSDLGLSERNSDLLGQSLRALAAVTGVAACLSLPVSALHAVLSGWSPSAIASYDLRPFRVEGVAAQLWMCRVWFGAWLVVAIFGGWALVAAAKGRGRQALKLTAGAALLGTACCLGFAHATAAPRPAIRIASLQGLEQVTHLHFPPGSALLEAYCLWGLDLGAEAVVSMPQAEAVAFLRGPVPQAASLGLPGGARLTLSRTNRLDIDKGGQALGNLWSPERARQFVAAHVETNGSNGRVYDLLANLDAPGTATVYLEYWTF